MLKFRQTGRTVPGRTGTNLRDAESESPAKETVMLSSALLVADVDNVAHLDFVTVTLL
jgi:hypothetical protein